MPKAQVRDSSAYFDSYAAAPRASDKPNDDKCSVGFWNLSPEALTIKVNGQSHVVPRGKSVKLDLGREFVWQVAGREPETAHVSPNQAILEIVIRR